MKFLVSIFIILVVSQSIYAQQQKDTLSLEQQFDQIYRTSSSYKEFKVIRKTRYQRLKQSVADSISHFQKELSAKNQLIRSKNDSIEKIKKTLSALDTDLKSNLERNNSMPLFGIQMSKTSYVITMWCIIIVLLIILLYFAFRFKSSNVYTVKAQDELRELEEEFTLHKKKSLEREQKLRRKLQDEINKQRGV